MSATICTIRLQLSFPADDCKRIHSPTTGWLLDLAGIDRLEFFGDHDGGDDLLGIYVRRDSPRPRGLRR